MAKTHCLWFSTRPPPSSGHLAFARVIWCQYIIILYGLVIINSNGISRHRTDERTISEKRNTMFSKAVRWKKKQLLFPKISTCGQQVLYVLRVPTWVAGSFLENEASFDARSVPTANKKKKKNKTCWFIVVLWEHCEKAR